MTREAKTVLSEAAQLIHGERRGEYGGPHESFTRIAEMWTAYLGYEVKSHDVAMMMALLKICRESHSHKRDNLIDLAGYTALCALLRNDA